MAYSNTTLLGLNQPTTGQEPGVWGDDVNNGLTQLVELTIAGTNNITQDSDITLAVSNGNNASTFTSTATNSTVAQYYILNCTGSRTAARNIIAPASSRSFLVTNGTTGGYAITIKKTAGTGVSIAAGETAVVYYNTVTGDYAKAVSTVITGTVPTTNGGTGLTSFTANGVVYASSTSALATGSAFVFDGTNVGIGTSSPSAPLNVYTSTATTLNVDIKNAKAAGQGDTYLNLYKAPNGNSNGLALYTGTTQKWIVGTGITAIDDLFKIYNATTGSAAVTIDASSNVGIGTSSPDANSLTVFNKNINIKSGTGLAYQLNFYSNNSSTVPLTLTQDSDSSAYLWNRANSFLGFGTNNTERMRIDASGNFLVNGTTTPFTSSGRGVININGTSQALLGFTVGGTDKGYLYTDGTNITLSNTPSGALIFQTNATERARIDSSGNLSIGTTSSGNKLYVVGSAGTIARIQSTGSAVALQFSNSSNLEGYIEYSSSNMNFYTNATQRATIDSSGNLLIGKTATGDTTVGAYITPSGETHNTLSASTNASNTYIVYSTGASAYRFYVDLGGTIHATSTSITAISDASLKENVKDLETGLNEVMALKPRRFDWKNGDGTNVAGFIAQELETVLPELVYESKYSIDENGNDITKKSIKMGDILPTLVKAIQELSAEVNQLKQKLGV